MRRIGGGNYGFEFIGRVNKMDLKKAREIIDSTDNEIAKLFEKRMQTVSEVAEYKKENNMPIYNGDRERDIINRLTEAAPSELALYVKVLYNTLFDVSRAYQARRIGNNSEIADKIKNALENGEKEMPMSAVIACQGKEGAYSGKAAEKMIYSPSIMYFNSFRGVFDAVKSGMCRYGVLPIENSIHGSVNEVYDLMEDYEFYIVKSIKMQVNHVLAANPETKEVAEILSHEQALGQCSEYLKNCKAKITACDNTAIAAENAAKKSGTAAICSKECAEVYGLKIIDENISDSDNNYTRFICISKKFEIYPGADRASFMLTLPHVSGSLYSVISKFAASGMNMTKIESRPIAGKDFEFKFYFEIEASSYSEELYAVLTEIENAAEEFRFFGCYK